MIASTTLLPKKHLEWKRRRCLALYDFLLGQPLVIGLIEVDDVWRVKVVEQGRGNRYNVNTNPYSLSRVASGEFVKVQESHIFANDTALILYESV